MQSAVACKPDINQHQTGRTLKHAESYQIIQPVKGCQQKIAGTKTAKTSAKKQPTNGRRHQKTLTKKHQPSVYLM